MNETTRRRLFVPLVMPLAILGAILLFSGSLSRILLAVETEISVLVAVLVAGYVLLMAFVVEKNPAISTAALTTGAVLGLAGLVGAGAIAQAVGVREIHHGEEEGGEGAVAGAGEEGGGEIPADALVWETTGALEYTAAPTSGPAGEVTLAIDNPTGLEHNVVFESFQGDAALVAATSGIDVASYDIPAGDWTYYCSIPGHRAAGMEGQITLS